MGSDLTKWEREMLDELSELFDGDEGVSVVADEDDIKEETVCVMPIEVDEPDGSGTSCFFLLWWAADVFCCDRVLWAWDHMPGVWNLGWQGGWDSDSERQCSSCGAPMEPGAC
jgi:hypothetical protein